MPIFLLYLMKGHRLFDMLSVILFGHEPLLWRYQLMIDMNTRDLFVAFAISFGHEPLCHHFMRFLQQLWRFQLMMALKLHHLEFHHHVLWTLCILLHLQVGQIYLLQGSISCVLIGRVHMAHMAIRSTICRFNEGGFQWPFKCFIYKAFGQHFISTFSPRNFNGV